MELQNVFYYTFSTIAQTLAGAIALLAAFLLYRLSTLNNQIEGYSLLISHALQNLLADAPRMHTAGQYRQILEKADEVVWPHHVPNPETERKVLHTLFDKRASLLSDFSVSLCLTIGLIIFSVLALNMTPKWAASEYSTIILSLSWICFVLCMLSYVGFLMNIFGKDGV